MKTSASTRRPVRMRRELQRALRALQTWESAIRSAEGAVANVTAASASVLLLAILTDARNRLSERLADLGLTLGVDSASHANSSRAQVVRRRTASTPAPLIDICVRACRSLGRAFGSAFREAQRLADLASAQILYGPLRQLEKQLWVLNPSQHV